MTAALTSLLSEGLTKKGAARLVLCLLVIASVWSKEVNSARSYADLSIEELMNESVTSVSKKETRLSESPAAITVITQKDIRRSGHTSLPELLRMVPGLNIARINANEWAVSARGFNNQYATKLLVLIDGRTVYSPMFGGVYWNAQDVVLEDLSRIEVIRGPGATLWGANAVNGVINIITKSAKATQGGLITGSYGTIEQPSTSIRYGGQLATNVFYRVYAKYFNQDGFMNDSGEGPTDSWNMARGGFRLDWEPSHENTLTLQGDYYSAFVDEHFERVTLTDPFLESDELVHHNYGANILGRWRRQFSESSELTFQSYYDRFHQGDGDIAETRETFDADLQHRFPIGSHQDIVWGLGYRYTADKLPPSFYLSFDPAEEQESLYSAFWQDEITLVPDRLKLTLGSKLEHNEQTGLELQPSGRLLWTLTTRQTVWGAVSRAVRTPARYDRDSRLNAAAFQPPSSPPVLVSLFANPHAVSEKLMAYELGYRIEATERLSLDIVGFFNVYDDLFTYVPGTMSEESSPSPSHLVFPLNFENQLSGETYGTEASAQWAVTENWKLIAGYTWLHMRLRPHESAEAESPQHQFHLRSYLNLPYRLKFNGAAYFVDHISAPLDNETTDIEAYLRLDLGLTWRPTRSLELGIWGQNLLQNKHAEFGSFKTARRTEIPRSVMGKVTWRF